MGDAAALLGWVVKSACIGIYMYSIGESSVRLPPRDDARSTAVQCQSAEEQQTCALSAPAPFMLLLRAHSRELLAEQDGDAAQVRRTQRADADR